MTERQKIKKVINTLRTCWPTTPDEARLYGIRLCKDSKSGAYRSVHKVRGLRLVIKFPGNDSSDKRHSIQEWIVYNKLKYCDRYKKLKKYMPTIYHFNMNTGVSAMRYYEVLGESNWRNPNKFDKSRSLLEKRVKKIYKHANDIDNAGNVARDKNGQLKIIDLGCFDEV